MADKLKRLRIYWKIWWTSSILSVESVLENRLGVAFLLSGKIVRFIFFIFFLVIINRQVQQIAGYSLNQMITFFLMFNLLDLFGQLFFRGIYWFRDQVVTGEFDFKLTKPVSPLFQALTRQTDILDLPLLVATIIFLFRQGITLTTSQALVFLITLVSGMVIVTAIHIAVAALGVMTTEVDHTIMIYRDLSMMARVPVDVYTDSVRALLTFVIPIAVAYTLPAKSLLGLVTLPTVLLALVISALALTLSLRLWHYALTQYSSASS